MLEFFSSTIRQKLRLTPTGQSISLCSDDVFWTIVICTRFLHKIRYILYYINVYIGTYALNSRWKYKLNLLRTRYSAQKCIYNINIHHSRYQADLRRIRMLYNFFFLTRFMHTTRILLLTYWRHLNRKIIIPNNNRESNAIEP